MDSKLRPETLCIQAGYTPKNGEPRQIPIVQSTTFKYDTSEDMGKLFDLEAEGYFYSRLAESHLRRRRRQDLRAGGRHRRHAHRFRTGGQLHGGVQHRRTAATTSLPAPPSTAAASTFSPSP